jgi:hypothetical protein
VPPVAIPGALGGSARRGVGVEVNAGAAVGGLTTPEKMNDGKAPCD